MAYPSSGLVFRASAEPARGVKTKSRHIPRQIRGPQSLTQKSGGSNLTCGAAGTNSTPKRKLRGAKIKQTVRKLRDALSAVRISRPTAAESAKNPGILLPARPYGAAHRDFARSASNLHRVIQPKNPGVLRDRADAKKAALKTRFVIDPYQCDRHR